MATNGLLNAETDPTGALKRVSRHGLRETLSTELILPTGLTLGPDGAAYISNFGIFPSSPVEGPPTGQVVRVSVPPVNLQFLPFTASE